MFDELKKLVESNGDKLAIVSMDNMRKYQADMEEYSKHMDPDVRNYMSFMLDDPKKFNPSATHMQSIIIAAVPRPVYVKVTWHARGRQYAAFSGSSANADKAADYIMSAVQAAGYEIKREMRLIQKPIAVASGLAKYGRNNIVYIDGWGSAFSLLAFSTTAPCDTPTLWRESVVSDTCNDCKICENLCPANAIVPGKFAIDSHKCLTHLYQLKDDFPDWLPATAHHSHYSCLMCQARCPMNKGLVPSQISFDEAETARILKGGPYDDVADELKTKIAQLAGLAKLATAPRNLNVLFDLMDTGHELKL